METKPDSLKGLNSEGGHHKKKENDTSYTHKYMHRHTHIHTPGSELASCFAKK